MSDKKIVHVMVDLETMGTAPDAMVLSIGACTFHPVQSLPSQNFYATINPKTSSGKMEIDTVKFWLDQAASDVKPPINGTTPEYQVVGSFLDWLQDKTPPNGGEPIIWANGTDFDIPKLDRLLQFKRYDRAWKYSSVRDCRTIFKLFGEYGIKPPKLNAHHALGDAVWQAEYLTSIINNLSKFVKIKEFEDAYIGNVSRGVLSPTVGDATSSGTDGETIEPSAG